MLKEKQKIYRSTRLGTKTINKHKRLCKNVYCKAERLFNIVYNFDNSER